VIRRVHSPLRQPPDQVCVDRSKKQIARIGAPAGAGDMTQDPCELGDRRVSRQPQARSRPDFALMRLPFRASLFSAAVLPAHGAREGLSAPAIPEEKRRSLVRDRERGDAPLASRAEPSAGKSESARLAFPEGGGIVLDAVGSRDPHGQRLTGEKNHLSRAVVENGARARAALIQNEDVCVSLHEAAGRRARSLMR
jgi:hypothetical protein